MVYGLKFMVHLVLQVNGVESLLETGMGPSVTTCRLVGRSNYL